MALCSKLTRMSFDDFEDILFKLISIINVKIAISGVCPLNNDMHYLSSSYDLMEYANCPTRRKNIRNIYILTDT